MKVFLYVVVLSMLQWGCATAELSNQYESKIVHVVLIWLQEPGNGQHIDKVIKMTRNLKVIPEVQEIRVGKVILSERQIVDDSFDVGLYMVFNSSKELERYLVHPMHVEAVRSALRPLASKIVVYDFKETS